MSRLLEIQERLLHHEKILYLPAHEQSVLTAVYQTTVWKKCHCAYRMSIAETYCFLIFTYRGFFYSLLSTERRGRYAHRHSVLEQSTIVTLDGSYWTSESDVILLHIAATVR
ncbi:hypothetical protein AVEN_100446-1 [Araneus ventricosus]|uniref:Uncharacterized protein n=1 Tax=Araneus ventricosus TaxID=182803 RepID=A0A4Y2CZK7_ARAVE|nr:hypothetical protein AVEN_100446-1 [Araneus ventricosus]